MNRQALVCRNILEKPDITQREMAKNMDISLGTVNGLVKECLAEGYIAEEENGKEKYLILLEKGKELLKPYKVDGALIIAAGLVPFCASYLRDSKGLFRGLWRAHDRASDQTAP